MALPFVYPFKSRVLNATSTTSNSITPVAVPARAKLVNAYWVPANTVLASSGTIDITVNGTTAGLAGGNTGWTGISISSSTGAASTNLGSGVSAGVQYLSAGDVLATVISSSVGGTISFVVQEF